MPASPPFVLEHDLKGILRFNQEAESRFQFDLELHPEPFIGSLSAPVILLALNPGLSDEDFRVHADEDLLGIIRDSALQTPMCAEHYYLSDSFSSTPGGQWWRAKLRRLADELQWDVAARAICCIQFYPYHSKAFSSIPEFTRTLEYMREALLDQLRLRKLVVVMRAWQQWSKYVPELHDYERVIRLRNPRNPCLSPGNLGDSHEIIRKAMFAGPDSD